MHSRTFEPRTIDVGLPHVVGRGIPIDLGNDKHGNRVVFWSRGERACGPCSGSGTFEEYRKHLKHVRYRIGPVVRTRSYCPATAERYDLEPFGCETFRSPLT